MSQLKLSTGVAPANPPVGQVSVYSKVDKLLYTRDDLGVESGPLGAGGITTLTGDVTAGPGSGSQAATVEGIQGTSVSAAAPIAGDTLVLVAGVWTPQAPGIVGPAQCIFVDPISGNDGTGTRGDASKPFLTILAAVGALAANDDCIVLAPGVHTVVAPGLGEPAFARVSFVGYGAEVTRVNFTGGVGDHLIDATNAFLNERLTVRSMTIALTTSTLGIVATGVAGAGLYMQGGVEIVDVHFVAGAGSGPPIAYDLKYCNRLVIDRVQNDGSAFIDTCVTPATLSQRESLLRANTNTLSTSIAWDDDVAAAFGTPMTRAPMRFIDCVLGAINLDGQPNVQPEKCRYRGLTASVNPLGQSLTGIAALWWEIDCIVDGAGGTAIIDFSTLPILDVAVSPVFLFSNPTWRGLVNAGFARVAEVNGRTTVSFSNISGPGSFAIFSPGLGIDGSINGANLMPTILIVGSGTFKPGVWRSLTTFGPLAPGPNIFAFPWGAAPSAPNWIQVTPNGAVPGEILVANTVAAPFNFTTFLIDATIGGGTAYVTLGWVNGY